MDAATELAAKRYARAVYDIAVTSGDAATWARALDSIAQFMRDRQTARFLENTRISEDVKRQLLEAGLDVPPLAMNLARLLVHKRRTQLAPAIALQFTELMEREQGLVRAHAVTAVPLSDDEREALARRIGSQTGKRVVLETTVDPDILGGVIVQIGDRLIDGSTKGRLVALKRDLMGAVG